MPDRAPSEDGLYCKYNDRIIELTGVGGDKGRIGALERKAKNMYEEIEKVKKAQHRIELKLVALSCLGATAGGGVVAGLMRLLGPG